MSTGVEVDAREHGDLALPFLHAMEDRHLEAEPNLCVYCIMPYAAHVVVFDGVCNLCNAWVQFVLRRDTRGEFMFAPAQRGTGAGLLNDAGYASDALETILLVSNGVVYAKSDAIIEICCRFGGAWRLARMARHIPRNLRDWVYDRVARNRYAIAGGRSTCVVPDGSARERFLD